MLFIVGTCFSKSASSQVMDEVRAEALASGDNESWITCEKPLLQKNKDDMMMMK